MLKTYGLIGVPLTHSFSKHYFTEKFKKESISDSTFELFPIPNCDELPSLLSSNPTLRGLTVTLPYKQTIIPYLNEMDETASVVGAVNCIKVTHQTLNGKLVHHLKGYNTDVYGFRQSIKPFLESQHERALILGTGGASKAVAYVLKQIGLDVFFVSRENKDKNPKVLLYSEVNNYVIDAFKLIVNASPVGTFPSIEDAPHIPYRFISSKHLLYDLVYNPKETVFLKRAKEQGASCVNGLSMLHLQADEAWRIWNMNS